MKRLAMVMVVLSLAGALGVVLASGAGATPEPKSQFIGDWEFPDDDGTNWIISIRGGNGPLHLKLTDDSFVGCPSAGPFMAIGRGTVDPADRNLLHARFWTWCRGYGTWRAESEITLEYDVSTGQVLIPGMAGCIDPDPFDEFDPCSGGIIGCIDLDPFDGFDECSDLP